MKTKRGRRYWIVKHGLDALTALPKWIWRTGEDEMPRSFGGIKKGDRWIGFAYADSDSRERRLSLVTGFYECVREAKHQLIPPAGQKISRRTKYAWMIEGESDGWQAEGPVAVPSIETIIHRSTFRQSTFISIEKDEYEAIRREVKKRQLKPSKIPLLGRNPRNEQEVLALVVAGRERLGIEEFKRIRTGFPDMLVKLRGRSLPVHLELELYSKSFLAHKHAKAMKPGGKFSDKDSHSGPNGSPLLPVGVLCWVDDAKGDELRKKGKVRRVFELQQLLRDGVSIKWRG